MSKSCAMKKWFNNQKLKNIKLLCQNCGNLYKIKDIKGIVYHLDEVTPEYVCKTCTDLTLKQMKDVSI